MRADWLKKKARLEENKLMAELALLSYSPAAWGLADRPVDEADEEAVINQLTRQTAPLDPNLPGLSDLDAALAESARLANEEKVAKECCVCFEELGDALFTLNCPQTRGLHKMCRECIISEKNKVFNGTREGIMIRYKEQWTEDGFVERQGEERRALAMKCPICRQPVCSAWSPIMRQPVCVLVHRFD
jgi:hypothetical protein